MVPCAFDRFDIRLSQSACLPTQPGPASLPCAHPRALRMHELIAFLSGRPVRLPLRPRSPSSPAGVGQRKTKGPCIAALSLCWRPPIASKTASRAPSAVPPHHTTLHTNHTATCPPANEALPVTVPLAGHAFPAIQALRSLHAFPSEPASVAADRPAPRKHWMPIADATVSSGHAPPQPELAPAPRTLGLSSSSGSSKLYHRCGWRAASVMRGQACLSRPHATDSSKPPRKAADAPRELPEIHPQTTASRHGNPSWPCRPFCSHPSPPFGNLGSSAQACSCVASLSCGHLLRSPPSKLS